MIKLENGLIINKEERENPDGALKHITELPFFGDKTDYYYESLVSKHVDYDFNAETGIEVTRMIYAVMGLDWYFHSNISELKEDGTLVFELRFLSDNADKCFVIKTDVIEYGFAVAMEFIEQTTEEKLEC